MKAAISSFGELWDVDKRSTNRTDVSSFKVNIRCQDVGSIPEVLYLMVDDRQFCIPIEVESWKEAAPILLCEDMDQRLGLVSAEAQDDFIKVSEFSSIPAAGSLRSSHSRDGSQRGLSRERHQMVGRASKPGPGVAISNSESRGQPSPQQYSTHAELLSARGIAAPASAPAGLPPCPLDPPTLQLLDPAHFPALPSRLESTFPPGLDGYVSLPASSLGIMISGGPSLTTRAPSGLEPEGTQEASASASPISGDGSAKRVKSSRRGLLTSGSLSAHRRSSHLAAKNFRSHRSSLLRTQDLKSSKLKMVRLAALKGLQATASSLAPVGGVLWTQPSAPRNGSPPGPSLPARGIDAVFVPREDLRSPLTTKEINLIKAACGIIDASSGTLAGPDVNAGQTSGSREEEK